MKFVSYEPNRIRIFRCSCVKNFRESYVFHCLVIKVVCLATACLLYHISQLFVNNFFQVVFLFFDIAFSSHTFHYPARAVRHVLFCICCFSDEDYLTTAVLNCQRFSCFLFISHNSDNSTYLLILYTKYLFSTFTYNKHIIIKNYSYSP